MFRLTPLILRKLHNCTDQLSKPALTFTPLKRIQLDWLAIESTRSLLLVQGQPFAIRIVALTHKRLESLAFRAMFNRMKKSIEKIIAPEIKTVPAWRVISGENMFLITIIKSCYE